MNVYSNAFNFSSHFNGSVDLRTGQYGSLIRLATLCPQGPLEVSRDFTLSFSMMDTTSGVYGLGWRLSNTEFDVATSRLTLLSGEQFQTQSLPPVGGTLVIKDRKLKDLAVKRVDSTTLQVIYKDGTVETLRRTNSTVPYRIVAIRFENGESLDVRYTSSGSLERILNHKQEELLVLTYSGGRLQMADARVDGSRYARTRFVFTGDRLTSVTAPYDRTEAPGAAAYLFGYTPAFRNGLVAMNRVQSPMGGVEQISYVENGHQYANGAFIPRVVTWLNTPGATQPAMSRSYTYSPSRNFTGYPFSGGFREGEDNLYLTASDYVYFTEETLLGATSALNVVTRTTYNKFHLLTEERTLREGTQTLQTITYNITPGAAFSAQPANLQLPRVITKQFGLVAGGAVRKEEVISETDQFGNELSSTDASGIRTEYSYYPIAGDGARCPPDPHGLFERYTRQERIVPALLGPLVRVTEHTHVRVAVGSSYFVAMESSTVSTGVVTRETYYEAADNPALHGRLKTTTMTLDSQSHVTEVNYTFSGDMMIETRRLRGADGQWLESARSLSLANRRVLNMTRDNGVVVAFEFDVIGRLVAEAISPGTPQQARRTYAYHFATSTTRANVVTTDAQGTRVISYFDGTGRPVAVAQLLEGRERAISTQRYDGLGQHVETTQVDLLSGAERSLVTRYAYNRWGNPSQVAHADGRVELDEYDPLLNMTVTGMAGEGRIETWFNQYNQPRLVNRVSTSAKEIQLESRTYDGLGRCTTLNDVDKNLTEYTYDRFDRLSTVVERPLGATPARTRVLAYAAGTTQELVMSINVDGKTLGTRSYDSLGRLKSEARGTTPATTWSYAAGSTQPASCVSPRGDRQDYRYDAQLDVLDRIDMAGHPQVNSQYDPVTALLRSSTTSTLIHEVQYDLNGSPREEMQSLNGTRLTAQYRYSPAGRLIHHTSAAGQSSELEYDPARGRLVKTTTGQVVAQQGYDEFGRLASLTTTHGTISIVAKITYDDLGREVERRIEQNTALLESITSTYYTSSLLATRVIKGANSQVVVSETFTYDGYFRLATYRCEGAEQPQDQQGRGIVGQVFSYDGLDNMMRVVTSFANGSQDTCTRYFQGSDPARLTRLTHTNPVQDQTLSYDASGNLLGSTAGRTLAFNGFDQLTSVQTGAFTYSYQYDAEARQVITHRGSEQPVMLAYSGDRLDGLVQGSRKIRFLNGAQEVLARTGGAEGEQLHINDSAGSVRGLVSAGQPLKRRHYTPYGDAKIALDDGVSRTLVDLQLPAFNGERLDVGVNLYHLGNGTRAYDPALGVFVSPDPLSPFGEGGINGYAYCRCNPVNMTDADGLFPSWLSWALTGTALAFSIVSLGFGVAGLAGVLAMNAAIAAGTAAAGAKAVVGAALAAKVLGVAASSMGLVSVTLAVASLGVAAVDKQMGWDRSQHIKNLGWASTGFGIASWGASFSSAFLSAKGAFGRAALAANNEKFSGYASLFDTPIGSAVSTAAKQITGLSYQFTQKSGLTWFSRTYGVVGFTLRSFNFTRGVIARVKSLQGGAVPQADGPPGAHPQPSTHASRFVDMQGSSSSFHESFSEVAAAIRRPILGELNQG